MANEFNFGNVSGATRTGFEQEEAALQALNEATALSVAVAADMADQTVNPLAPTDDEYVPLMNAAAEILFKLVVQGAGAVVIAISEEPAVASAMSKFGEGSDFPARKDIGIARTDDDASLAVDGVIAVNTSGEINDCLQDRDPNYQYFDWGIKVVPADLKESFGWLKKYQKQAIIDNCPAQTDTTGSVWTCTDQTAADQIIEEYTRLLKKVK